MSDNDIYMEIAEITELDFFVGVQFHPEFNTSIFEPNKVILAFIKNAYKYQFNKIKQNKRSSKQNKRSSKQNKQNKQNKRSSKQHKQHKQNKQNKT